MMNVPTYPLFFFEVDKEREEKAAFEALIGESVQWVYFKMVLAAFLVYLVSFFSLFVPGYVLGYVFHARARYCGPMICKAAIAAMIVLVVLIWAVIFSQAKMGIPRTMYANSEDFQVLAISTMVSLFGAEWNDHKKSTPFSHECSVQELLTRCGASDSRFRCVFVCIAARLFRVPAFCAGSP